MNLLWVWIMMSLNVKRITLISLRWLNVDRSLHLTAVLQYCRTPCVFGVWLQFKIHLKYSTLINFCTLIDFWTLITICIFIVQLSTINWKRLQQKYSAAELLLQYQDRSIRNFPLDFYLKSYNISVEFFGTFQSQWTSSSKLKSHE